MNSLIVSCKIVGFIVCSIVSYVLLYHMCLLPFVHSFIVSCAVLVVYYHPCMSLYAPLRSLHLLAAQGSASSRCTDSESGISGLRLCQTLNSAPAYGQFSKFHVCFCGLDPGNLKFETVRTNKQPIYF